MQGRPAAFAADIGVGLMVQQQPDGGQMAAAGGLVQRRIAGLVDQVGPCAVGQQRLDGGGVALGGGRVQGRLAAIVAGVGRSPGAQQQLGHLAMARRRRPMQRRQLVVLAVGDAVRICGQYGPRRIHVARRGGPVQVGHRLGFVSAQRKSPNHACVATALG